MEQPPNPELEVFWLLILNLMVSSVAKRQAFVAYGHRVTTKSRLGGLLSTDFDPDGRNGQGSS